MIVHSSISVNKGYRLFIYSFIHCLMLIHRGLEPIPSKCPELTDAALSIWRCLVTSLTRALICSWHVDTLAISAQVFTQVTFIYIWRKPPKNKQWIKNELFLKQISMFQEEYGPPSQADPSVLKVYPIGHSHSKLPSVLMQVPPRHKSGFVSHSSMSVTRGRQEMRVNRKNKTLD